MIKAIIAMVWISFSIVPTDAACIPSQWCQTWPIPGVANSPMVTDEGWNVLVFSSATGRFYLYADDQWGPSNDPWEDAFLSYQVLGAPAISQPWRIETACDTDATHHINQDHLTLAAPMTSTDVIAAVQVPAALTSSEIYPSSGTLNVGAEEMDYTAATGDVIGSTQVAFTGLTRGARRSAGNGAPSAHIAGAWVHLACPAPRFRGLPAADHPANRHPYRLTAFDSRRNRLWEAGGTEETYAMRDTWFLCLAPSADCSAAQLAAGWTRVITSTADFTADIDFNGNIPGNAESAMTYDPDNDVIVMYGGIAGGETYADTWLFCFSVNLPIGCAAANRWNRVATIGDAGPRDAPSMTYDTANHHVLVFGGVSGATTYNTVGIYDTATRTWSTSSAATGNVPAGRRFPAFTFDSRRRLAAYYEGPAVYLYDPAGNHWTLSGVAGGPAVATPYDGNNLAYDSIHDVYVFENAPDLQTWELPGGALDAIATTPGRPQGLAFE